jgi:hypothetical protein
VEQGDAGGATEVALSGIVLQWAESASEKPFRLQHYLISWYAGTIEHNGPCLDQVHFTWKYSDSIAI